MNQNKTQRPPVREVYYVVLATFTLYLITLLIVSGSDPVSLLLGELSVVLPAVIWIRVQKYPFSRVFRLHHFHPGQLILGGVIGFGFSLLTGELNFLIQQAVPMQREVLEGLTEAMVYESKPEMVLLILNFVFVAGVGEEMLFRGLLLGSLEKSLTAIRAVVYSALVFTFMHFNPWWTLEIFLMGVLTGLLAWRSGSLYPAIAMHATMNLMSLLLTNGDLPFLGLYLESGHIKPVWLIVSGVCVVAGVVYLYAVVRTRNVQSGDR